MNDDAVPYAPVPHSTVQEFPGERLTTIVKAHLNAVSQLRGIHRGGFGSTTEAELVLKVLETVDPIEDRIGLMEFFLAIFKSEVVKAARIFKG